MNDQDYKKYVEKVQSKAKALRQFKVDQVLINFL